MSSLFTPVSAGALSLPNRIVMAPMTRCRADTAHVPTALLATHYEQRATAGLLISEATMVAPDHAAFGGREPGIYNDEQARAWAAVTAAVHAKGGRIVLQLWHGGRACHSAFGVQPVAPSPIAIQGFQIHTPKGKVDYEVPRELADSELPGIVAQFGAAARRAKAAGFDGVELHGANGYLLNQFLFDGSNKRPGRYGGSLENRARLLLEATDAAIKEIGADRVGVRISPLNSYNSMLDSDPIAVTRYVASELEKRHIAYLHVMRSDFLGQQKGDVLGEARKHFHGTLVGNMGYTPEEANKDVQEGKVDAIAFGHHFISNPTLVEKVKGGVALVEPDQSFFYGGEEKGYTDYQ